MCLILPSPVLRKTRVLSVCDFHRTVSLKVTNATKSGDGKRETNLDHKCQILQKLEEPPAHCPRTYWIFPLRFAHIGFTSRWVRLTRRTSLSVPGGLALHPLHSHEYDRPVAFRFQSLGVVNKVTG